MQGNFEICITVPLKNDKRFVETFKNYASYIHTFSLTDNFHNSRKKGKKRGKNLILEAVFRRCSVKKVFLKISQEDSQENTSARQKQPFENNYAEKRFLV